MGEYSYISTYPLGIPTPHQFHTLPTLTPILPLFSFLSFTTLYMVYRVVVYVRSIVLPLLDNVAHSIFCDIRTKSERTKYEQNVAVLVGGYNVYTTSTITLHDPYNSYLYITPSSLLQAHTQSYIRLQHYIYITYTLLIYTSLQSSYTTSTYTLASLFIAIYILISSLIGGRSYALLHAYYSIIAVLLHYFKKIFTSVIPYLSTVRVLTK